MIEVDRVSKRFRLSKKQRREMGENYSGGKFIQSVSDVSFKCAPGKIFTLLGPNGAGKTTTLRMLGTILTQDSGRINIAGLDTLKEPDKVRGKIGFLTGTTGLYARLTPEEMVKYYANLYGISGKKYIEKRNSLFDLLEIHKFKDRRIGKLSSGMKQKVSIARTLIHDPEVVIFDEPTVGLDVITSRNIIKLIRDCRDEGKTVIFSTHIMGEVSMLSDDLAIMDRGRIIFNDTFKKFKNEMTSATIEDEFVRIVGGEK
ncbi:MAG: ATP-binding cassette domain-containing protein [Candidatus Aminicenantes bacterium]|nr:ATP-binding cassette domain-containing protein [Candidatus Aminicenantes bacterium]